MLCGDLGMFLSIYWTTVKIINAQYHLFTDSLIWICMICIVCFFGLATGRSSSIGKGWLIWKYWTKQVQPLPVLHNTKLLYTIWWSCGLHTSLHWLRLSSDWIQFGIWFGIIYHYLIYGLTVFCFCLFTVSSFILISLCSKLLPGSFLSFLMKMYPHIDALLLCDCRAIPDLWRLCHTANTRLRHYRLVPLLVWRNGLNQCDISMLNGKEVTLMFELLIAYLAGNDVLCVEEFVLSMRLVWFFLAKTRAGGVVAHCNYYTLTSQSNMNMNLWSFSIISGSYQNYAMKAKDL